MCGEEMEIGMISLEERARAGAEAGGAWMGTSIDEKSLSNRPLPIDPTEALLL
jgi:hypothetical protein